MLIAADHPARGSLAARGRPQAMADRGELLSRLVTALERPGVDGVLGTPDIVEDLLLLGALEDKIVIGSMNRGGLSGSVFELDDRFTAYDTGSIAAMGLDGGKMLIRIALEDRHARAAIREDSRGGKPGDTAADHHDVEIGQILHRGGAEARRSCHGAQDSRSLESGNGF